MLSRDKQIELMEKAETRLASYAEQWKRDPQFHAALHRNDADGDDKEGDSQVAAFG